MSDAMSALAWGTAAAFALVFPALSYRINRGLCDGRLSVDVSRLALLASLTFFAAILFEVGINSVYEALIGEKLWEYRVLPLHDRNVSALSVLVWTAYGVHLYFVLQSLQIRGPRRMIYKAALVGAEAPLLWEVSGNAFFLSFTGEFYAYYHPDDLFHFTSIQVIPLYIATIFVGLLIYEALQRCSRLWPMTGFCFGGGLLFLATG